MKDENPKPCWWVEVKYGHGWGRHTRTYDRRWADDLARLLLTTYPETRVIPEDQLDPTPLPKSTCPVCGYEMDAATRPGNHEDKPGPGDLSLCMKCGEVGAFRED